MSKFSEALARIKPRLFAMCPFIAAGAVASVATAQEPTFGIAIATILQTLAGLAINITSTDVHTLSERILNDDVLRNQDLAKAVRDAIGAVIEEAKEKINDTSEKGALEKIAKVSEWEEVEAPIWEPRIVEQLSAEQIVEMFSKTPDEFAQFKALDPDAWQEIIGGLAAVNEIALEGDALTFSENLRLSKKTINLVAAHLYETFPRALYEILKYDFAHEGKAYGDLLMKLVGRISAKQDKIFDNTEEILSLLRSSFSPTSDANTRPLLCNLPPRNQIFAGRKDVLAALNAELEKRGRVALGGMPGVGKTQTAIEYAHEQHQVRAYPYIVYTRATSETQLLTDYARVAQQLNLPVKDNADLNLVAAAVKDWFERTEKWLLILDNADDLRVVSSATHNYLPANPKGHVLFTRRPVDAGGFAHTIKLDTMAADEGALLLLRRTGLVKGAGALAGVSTEVVEQARAIAREMDGLPLSLNIAGAFIKETSTSLDEYLELYCAEGRQLRQERDLSDPYEHSVAAAFSLAFKQMSVPDDDREGSATIALAAADLLRLCAFFGPDAIPLELILSYTPSLDEEFRGALDNKIWRKKIIAKATRFSLLNANHQTRTYDVHREVQAVLRDEMDETQCVWAERALQTLAAIFPAPDDFVAWETCDLLLPHAQDCLKQCDRLGVETDVVAHLKNQIGFHLKTRARYAEAEPLYKQAWKTWSKVLGPEHPYVATCMNNLAEMYLAQGHYAEAEPLLEKALEIRKGGLGPEHPDIAATMNNLAEMYRLQARYTEAESLFKQASEIWKKAFGPEHQRVALGINNLALLYAAQGRHAEAVPLAEQALEIRVKVLGPEHPEVAQSLNNLAGLYLARGRYVEAESLYKESLELGKKVLGPEHPDVAQSLNNLAALYSAWGRYAEAEPLTEQALELRRNALGSEHPSVAQSLNNLAGLYRKQGRYAEAQSVYEMSLKIARKTLGLEHPDVTQGLNNLAGLYAEQGRYAEAEPLLEKSLELRRKVLGPEHPDIALSLNNLAEVYSSQGRYEEAETLYEQALKIEEKSFSSEHPHIAVVMNNLAETYRLQGRYEEAETLYEKAVEIWVNAFGPEHLNIATGMNNFALMCTDQRRYMEAELLHQGALSIRTKALGPGHPDVATSMNNLAMLYYAQGRYAEAEPLIRQALEINKKVFGLENRNVAMGMNTLAELYRLLRRYAEAEPLYDESLKYLKKVFGSEHPNVAMGMNNLALLYNAQGRYAEAEPLYGQALALCEKLLGDEHPLTRTIGKNFEKSQREKAL
jgi:tetratricopeptide (TPR) repeat protein